MTAKKQAWVKRIFLILLAAFLAVIAGILFLNRLPSDFSQLKETEQAVLSEYDVLCAQEKVSLLWQEYSISEKPTVFMPKGSLSVYLVNPSHEIDSIFAKKLTLPDNFSTNSVYRVSSLHPEVWRMKASGNFNTLGETYSLLGEQVYFFQYDEDVSLSKPYTSEHFLTFLVHESFHYYMQNQWEIGEYPYIESLTQEDMELLRQEYAVLDAVKQALQGETVDQNQLLSNTRQYVSIIDKRIASNPAYTMSELSKERDEGTAAYVSIKASELVDYDYGVMYFDNVKDVPFSDVFEQIDAGNVDTSFLYARMPYETGALLCELMDALELPNWQSALNSQTPETPQTLYSVLKEFVETMEPGFAYSNITR